MTTLQHRPDGHMLSIQAVQCGAGSLGANLRELVLLGSPEEFPQELWGMRLVDGVPRFLLGI